VLATITSFRNHCEAVRRFSPKKHKRRLQFSLEMPPSSRMCPKHGKGGKFGGKKACKQDTGGGECEFHELTSNGLRKSGASMSGSRGGASSSAAGASPSPAVFNDVNAQAESRQRLMASR